MGKGGGKGGGKCASRERFASSSRTPRLPAPRHSTTFKPAESSRAVGPESSHSNIREPFLPKREETSQSTEQDPLKGEDDDLDTDVIFDQPETESESRRHLLFPSPASKMQNGSATKPPTGEARSQVALPATAKEEPTISQHEPKVEVSSIHVARAARKEPVLVGDISTVSSTNIETKPPQHPPLTEDTDVRMVAPGGTKSQLDTNHITPAAESTQVSQVSALVAGMVYKTSKQVDKEDPSVFQKTSDVKEEATNSAFNVRKQDVPRDEKDIKKMEQENTRPSLLRESRQPSRVEKRTTPALAEKTLVESVNKGAPVVAQEEKYSHIERAPMVSPLESKTQIQNESSAEKQPKEDAEKEAPIKVAAPIQEAFIGAPLAKESPIIEEKPVELVPKAKEDIVAPAHIKEKAAIKYIPVGEDSVEDEAATLVEFVAPEAKVTASAKGIESPVAEGKTIELELHIEAAPAVEEDAAPIAVAAPFEEASVAAQLAKDPPFVEEKPVEVAPEAYEQVLATAQLDKEHAIQDAPWEHALDNSTPITETASGSGPHQQQDEAAPSLVRIVQSGQHQLKSKETQNEPEHNVWRSWKRTLESEALKGTSTSQPQNPFRPFLAHNTLFTPHNPPTSETRTTPIQGKKAIDFESKAEPAPAMHKETSPDALDAPIQNATMDAQFHKEHHVSESKVLKRLPEAKEEIVSHVEAEEAAFEESPVKESVVEEEATPLVEEKEFVAPVEEVESAVEEEKAVELDPKVEASHAVEEEKAVELESEVEASHAVEEERGPVVVDAPIEEAYVEATLAEASPVVEEKSVEAVPEAEEEIGTHVEAEEAAFEENPVEESVVEEEATPLVEKEFVAPVEEVESAVEEEKVVELESEVDASHAVQEERGPIAVDAPIEEAYVEATLDEASPVVEEKSVEAVPDAEEEIGTHVEAEEAAFEESPVEESVVEEEAMPLVQDKEFVAPVKEVESAVEEDKAVELESKIEVSHAVEEDHGPVTVDAPIKEAYVEATLDEASPVVEEKPVKAVPEAEEEIGTHVEAEEAAFEESPVEESVVEEEATPLVEENEFMAPLEEVESAVEEEKAVELESEVEASHAVEEERGLVAVDAPIEVAYVEAMFREARPVLEDKSVETVPDAEEEIGIHVEAEETAFEESPVEESVVEEEATPLVKEKEFVAPVEEVESAVEEEKAVELESKIEVSHAVEEDHGPVTVDAPIKEAYVEATLDEASPVVEEKSVEAVPEAEEEIGTHVEAEEAAFEESLVEESVVEEEATPLVEEKEFVAPLEEVESAVEEEKAVELESEVEASHAVEDERSRVAVDAPIEEAYVEAMFREARPVLEDKSVETVPDAEEEIGIHVEAEETAFEESPVEESVVEEEATPLVKEKEFVAPVEEVESAVEEEKAVELESKIEVSHAVEEDHGPVTVDAPIKEAYVEATLDEASPVVEEKPVEAVPEAEEEIGTHVEAEEAAFEESLVEESVVEEEAMPLVEEKEFVAPVEEVESVMEEEKAVQLESEVEASHAAEEEHSPIALESPIEVAYVEASLDEASPLVEEKSVETVPEAEEKIGTHVEAEEAAFEESPVEEVESAVEEEKAVELESEVDASHAVQEERGLVAVDAPFEVAYAEGTLDEASSVVEEKSVEAVPEAEEEIGTHVTAEEAAFEESPVEESVVEEEATPLVEDKEFVAPVEEVESAVEEEKAVELESEVDASHAVDAPIEEAYVEAMFREARPVVEEKSVETVPEAGEEIGTHVEAEDAAFEESPVEESVVEEEATPLDEEKEFVAPVEEVESAVEEDKAVELESEIEALHAVEEDRALVAVDGPIGEPYVEAMVREARPVFEEKSVETVPEAEEEIGTHVEPQETAFEEGPVEESVVGEEATPLVEEKEFVAPMEEVESAVAEEKAVELESEVDASHVVEKEHGPVAVDAPIEEAYVEATLDEGRPVLEEKSVETVPEAEEEIGTHVEAEETAFQEGPVEESVLEEEATPLVEGKEFVAPVEEVESAVAEEKAVELESEVDASHAVEEERGPDTVDAPIEEAYVEAMFREAMPVLEEKSVETDPEAKEAIGTHVEAEEAAFEDGPVEESVVEEEATPLFEEKEFVAPVEEVESAVAEEKAIELESEVDASDAVEEECGPVAVDAPIEEAYVEATLDEARPVLEEKLVEEEKAVELESEVDASHAVEEECGPVGVDVPIEVAYVEATLDEERPMLEETSVETVPQAEEEIGTHVEAEETTFEEGPVAESVVEKKATPLVEEKEFVGPVEEVESAVEEEKAVELESEVDVSHAVEEERGLVAVDSPIEEGYVEAMLREARPVLEEKSVETVTEAEEEIGTHVEAQETAFEEGPEEESVVGKEATPLVEEKEFVAPVEEVESAVAEEKAVELESEVDASHAVEEDRGLVAVDAPIEEAYVEATLDEARPVLEENSVETVPEAEDEIGTHVEAEEAAFEEGPEEESVVEEEATPLVEGKEFVAPVEEVESAVEEEKAVELESEVDASHAVEEEHGPVAVDAPIEEAYVEATLDEARPVLEEKSVETVLEAKEEIGTHVEAEEAAFEESPVEESVVEEDATPLVEEKEFVAPVEGVESAVDEEKAIELESEVDASHAVEEERGLVAVDAPIEEAYVEAMFREARPVVEEKSVEAVPEAEEKIGTHVEAQETAFEEGLVEESVVGEESLPLVEEKEFVAPMEEVESAVEEEKAVELESEIEASHAVEEERALVAVDAPIEEGYVEAMLREARPVLEEKSVETVPQAEEEIGSHVEAQETAFEEGPVEESVVGEESLPLVEEKEFVGPVEEVGSAVEEEKAVELESEIEASHAVEEERARVAVDAPIEEGYVEAMLREARPVLEEKSVETVPQAEEEIGTHVEAQETAFEEGPVEESVVGEESLPLVEEKEFVAPMEEVESAVEEEKAVELESEIEASHAVQEDHGPVIVETPIEEAYVDGTLDEATPVVEEKSVETVPEAEDEIGTHVEAEETAFEESPVEESVVEEEATPLVEDKEFVAPVEEVESAVEEEKAVELESEVDASHAVDTPIEEAYVEAMFREARPVVEEKSVEAVPEAEEEIGTHVESEETAFEEGPVEESVVEEDATPLVEEKEFVAPVEAVESAVEEEKAVELESEVDASHAVEEERGPVAVDAPIEEAYVEAMFREARPVVEEKSVEAVPEAEEEIGTHVESEETAFEEGPVEESVVEEEATPLVEEKEFVAPVQGVESAVEEEKAVELESEVDASHAVEEERGPVAVDAPIEEAYVEAMFREARAVVEEKSVEAVPEAEEEIGTHVESEETAFEEGPVEESVVEEEATPLVEEKEFVAPVQGVESAVEEEKAVELESEVDASHAVEEERGPVAVDAPIEEAYVEAMFREARPVVEEKSVEAVPEAEEEIGTHVESEETAFEEGPVEESVVEEEATPLVEEKEFVAPVEGVESAVDEEKAVELESEVDASHAVEEERGPVAVDAPIEEAYVEAMFREARAVVEEKSVEAVPEAEEEIGTHVESEETAFEEGPVEESVVEEDATPLVEEKEFVAPVEGVESAVDEEKAVELESEVDASHAVEEERGPVAVDAPIEEAYVEAMFREARPVVEEKSVEAVPEAEEEIGTHVESEETAFEEGPVEESVVEEDATPLVEEKEFVAPVEAVESAVEEEKAVELESEVDASHAVEEERGPVAVDAPIEEAYVEAMFREARPVVEEKSVEAVPEAEEEIGTHVESEETAFEEGPVEESVVEEDATPLVEEKEFVAPVEAVESAVEEEKAVELESEVDASHAVEEERGPVAVDAPIEEAYVEAMFREARPVVEEKSVEAVPEAEEEIGTHVESEETAFEEGPVEESVVEEEATPLVEEKEFVAPVQGVESAVDEEKAVELESEVDASHAVEEERGPVAVDAPIEEAYVEAMFREARPVVEEKSVEAVPEAEEEIGTHVESEETAFEEGPVEESVVEEEATPLVEEKEFVAPVQGVESAVEEEKAVELESEVDASHAVEEERGPVAVDAPIEEAYVEAMFREARPVVEEKSVEAVPEAEEEIGTHVESEETAFEEGPVEESVVEEEATPLVEEKEFVAPVEGVESAVDEEKAVELESEVDASHAVEEERGPVAVDAPIEEAYVEAMFREARPVVEEKSVEAVPEAEEEIGTHVESEETAFEEGPVEESVVEEDATPLVEEKEFVAPVQGVESAVEEEKAVELESEVDASHAVEEERGPVAVDAPIEEAYVEAMFREARPVVEEKSVEAVPEAEEEIGTHVESEETAFEEGPVEESVVEEDATPLVEEKEFVAPVQGVESAVEEEKAVELESEVDASHAVEEERGPVAVDAPIEEAYVEAMFREARPVVEEKSVEAVPEAEEEIGTHVESEETAFEEGPVEESVVEEDATPLVEEKEFVAPVEAVESAVEEEKAVELESEVDASHAVEEERGPVAVDAPIEEAYVEAMFREARPVVEEKSVEAVPEAEEEIGTHVESEETAFEEGTVEESVVEEDATPLVEEKEFVAPVEGVESAVDEEKAVELESEVDASHAVEEERGPVAVDAPIEEAYVEAMFREARPVVEEKSVEAVPEAEEEIGTHVESEETAFEEGPVEESVVEEDATPLVEEKEFVAPVEAVESAVDEEKAVELESEVDASHAVEEERGPVAVDAPIEEAYVEAMFREARPVVEEKSVEAVPEAEEEIGTHVESEETAFEEGPVEESVVEEEATPLVEEKEFVAPVEAVESAVEEENAVELESEVDASHAVEEERGPVAVDAPIEEAYVEAMFREARPVVEEKSVEAVPEAEEEIGTHVESEETAFEEGPVEESVVEEEATPLVEEKEFVAPVEAVESAVEEEKAVELESEVDASHAVEEERGPVAVDAPIEEAYVEAMFREARAVVEEKSVEAVPEAEEEIGTHVESEETAFEEGPVEESVVEEEATPLVEEKEFVAPVEAVESAVEEEKAVELESEVDASHAVEEERGPVAVDAPIEEAYVEAMFREARPVVEEKSVEAVPEAEEEIGTHVESEETAFEEGPVEESVVEEDATPLVEEKEFVAPVEGVESAVDEEKAVELESEVDASHAVEEERGPVAVDAPIEEAYVEAMFREARPVVEEKSVEAVPEAEEEIGTHVESEETAFEEGPVEESVVEEEATPLVEEKEFVAPEGEVANSMEEVVSVVEEVKVIKFEPEVEAASVVEDETGPIEVDGAIQEGFVEAKLGVRQDGIQERGVVFDFFVGNVVRLRKNSEEASVDVHVMEADLVGGLNGPILFKDGANVEDLNGNFIGVASVSGIALVIEVGGAKTKIDEVSVDVSLEDHGDDEGIRQDPISRNGGFSSEVDGFDMEHDGDSGAEISENVLTKPFEHMIGKDVDVDNMSTMRAAEEMEFVNHGCANDSMEGSEWELVTPELVEFPNNTGNAIKTRENNEENVHLSKELPIHGTKEKFALSTEWEFVAEELQDIPIKYEGPGVQSSPSKKVKEFIESFDWEMVPTGSGAKDENSAEYIEMTKESVEIPTAKEDENSDVLIGGERVLNSTSAEEKPNSTSGLDRELPHINAVHNKDQETEDAIVDARGSEVESPLEKLQEEHEIPIKSPFNVDHFKKRPLGVATRKLKHVIQEAKIKAHKAVLLTWPPSPITSEEEDNTHVVIDVENATVVGSGHVPSVVDVEITEEPSVATTWENMEVSEEPHTLKNDEQEETNLSRLEEHDSEAFSQSVNKDTQLATNKNKDMASVLQSLENGSNTLISDLLLEGNEEVAAAASA